jgi:hypothetical protein
METQSNEELVAQQLRRLVSEGTDGGFLIVSGGEFYVQFAHWNFDDESTLVFEIASNLSQPGKLSGIQESQIRGLGFEDPTPDVLETHAGTPNFSREYQVTGTDIFVEIANTTSTVFTDVFGLALDSPLEFELNLNP